MRIPRYVQVKNASYAVKFKKKILHEGEICLGLCDANSKIIWLQKDLPEEMLFETFLHEYTHAVRYECHWPVSEEINELVADSMASCLIQAFVICPIPNKKRLR